MKHIDGILVFAGTGSMKTSDSSSPVPSLFFSSLLHFPSHFHFLFAISDPRFRNLSFPISIVNKLQNLHPPDNYALPTGSPSYLISLQPSANSLSLFQQRYPNLYGQVFRQRSLTLRREKMGENTTWLNEHDFEET